MKPAPKMDILHVFRQTESCRKLEMLSDRTNSITAPGDCLEMNDDGNTIVDGTVCVRVKAREALASWPFHCEDILENSIRA
jgi:hypothetical protein